MSEYTAVTKTPLKLKTNSGIKKKKKNKEKEKTLEKIAKLEKSTGAEHIEELKPKLVPLTKAERSFLKMKEKKQTEMIMDKASKTHKQRVEQTEMIMDKASKTHKQRVEEFNRHLDSLTEHYDIPKVSWTK